MIADLIILAVGITIGYCAPWAVKGLLALAKPYVDRVRAAGEEAAKK